MNDIILHHYEISPFSEKIRLMFGHCGLSWKSAISPPLPPRTIVDPLAGGYRKIPVLQIGADIFCDTKIISREIADISEKADLALENCSSEIQEFTSYSDSIVFMAVVTSSPPAKAIRVLLNQFSVWQTLRFIKDRAGVSKNSLLKSVPLLKSKQIVENYFNDLEDRLKTTPYIFGDTACIADFSAYHLIWFKNKFTDNNFNSEQTNLERWFDQMSNIGHGTRLEISRSDVFNIATTTEPRKISDAMTRDSLIGTRVEIKPNDYAQDTTVGKLVGVPDLRWIIARESKRFGILHVHFPKKGYELVSVL